MVNMLEYSSVAVYFLDIGLHVYFTEILYEPFQIPVP